MTNKYTSIDLFCGPGGLTTGLKLSGITPLIAVEINRETAETYCVNHDAEFFELEKYLNSPMEDMEFPQSNKPILIFGDICNVSDILIKKLLKERFLLEKVDLITGGPPCESYSIAGKRNRNDKRDFLYLHLLRIARAVNASMVLFENVKGILSKKTYQGDKTFFSMVCEEFEKCDSSNKISFRLASWHKEDILMNCVEYGVPQNRERVFLIGINNTLENVYFNYPKKTHGIGLEPYTTVYDAISDLPIIHSGEEDLTYNENEIKGDSIFMKFVRGISPGIPKEVNFISNFVDSHKASSHHSKTIIRMSLIKSGENMKSAAERLIQEKKEDLRNRYFPKKPYGARYRRLKGDFPSFTVTSHCFDEMIHPNLDRAITPREAARLQTFPDWYIFKGPYVIFHSDPKQDRYEQIGDAVPPLVAYRLGEELINTLSMIK